MKISRTNNLGVIAVRTYQWPHQIRQKTLQNARKSRNAAVMHVHTYYGYPLKANFWGFCTVLRLDSTLDAMIIGTHSFHWYQATEKRALFYIWHSWKWVYHFRECITLVSVWRYLQGMNLTWKLAKLSPKSHFSRAQRPQKLPNELSSSICRRLCQC